jgi:hypothetical protein
MSAPSKILCLCMVFLLGSVVPAVIAQPRVVDAFDDGSTVTGQWSRWWGDQACQDDGILPEMSFDSAMDAAGTASGSMKVVSHFTATCGSNALCRWVGFGDMTGYASLDFDVYVDGASAVTGWGSHGWLQWGYFDTNWVFQVMVDPAVQLNGGGDDNRWVHVSIPMTQFPGFSDTPSSAANMNGVGFQFAGWGNVVGDVTIWLDNIEFIPSGLPPIVPATTPMVLNRFDSAGEVNSDDWQQGDWTAVTITRFEFDPNQDAGGGAPGSGSLYIEANFPTDTSCSLGCNQIQVNRDLHGSFDFRGYGFFEFDYRVTSDSAIAGGRHGGLEFFPLTGASWTDIQAMRPAGWDLGGGANDDHWVHVRYPTTGAGAPCIERLFDDRAFRLQVWGGDLAWDPPENVLNGTVKMWIDNIVWTPPAPDPVKGWYVVGEFDSADESSQWTVNADAPEGTTVSWDPTADYADNPGSGALKISIPTWGSGQQVVLTKRISAPGEDATGVDLRDYTHITFRLKVDPASAHADWGGYAGGGVVCQNSGWSWDYMLGNPPGWQNFYAGACGGWTVLDGDFPSTDSPRRDSVLTLLVQLSEGGWGLNGPGTFWIDHIRFGRPTACADPNGCELCNDNGNGLANCDDPDCHGTIDCPIETVCDDFIDNDYNGLIDCADPECAESPNCKAHVPFADLDGDNDVDQEDFGLFQACFSGSDHFKSGCGMVDRNLDLMIDQFDLQSFEACISGPGIKPTLAGNPNCEGLTQ